MLLKRLLFGYFAPLYRDIDDLTFDRERHSRFRIWFPRFVLLLWCELLLRGIVFVYLIHNGVCDAFTTCAQYDPLYNFMVTFAGVANVQFILAAIAVLFFLPLMYALVNLTPNPHIWHELAELILHNRRATWVQLAALKWCAIELVKRPWRAAFWWKAFLWIWRKAWHQKHHLSRSNRFKSELFRTLPPKWRNRIRFVWFCIFENCCFCYNVASKSLLRFVCLKFTIFCLQLLSIPQPYC